MSVGDARYLIEDRLEAIERKLDALGEDRSNVVELWLPKKKLALTLGVSERWLDYRVDEGLPHRRIAGRRVFQLHAAESWLRKRGHIEEVG
jgi:hypothetical protein